MRDMRDAQDQADALVIAYANGDADGAELLLTAESADWKGMCEILAAYMSVPVTHLIRHHGVAPRDALEHVKWFCRSGCPHHPDVS